MGRFLLAQPKNDPYQFEWGSLLALLCHGCNFVVLLLDLSVVGASKMRQNFTGFAVSSNTREESRRIGKHLHAGKEDDRWQTLEGQQEAPSDLRVSSVQERESEVDPVCHGDPEIVCNEDVS